MLHERNFCFFLKGDAGDSLTYHNQMQFSTRDNVNDLHGDCATGAQGAWWYKRCYESNLNGRYPTLLSWRGFNGDSNFLKKTEMKIRPSQF